MVSVAWLVSVAWMLPTAGLAQDVAESEAIVIGDTYAMDVPSKWVKKEPRSQIVEREFAVTAVADDETDGRVTMMGAGGSVKANIDRWIGQFTQPDGSATKQRAKVTKREIGGQTVHIVDISGTYKDRPQGPFGPSVDQASYRMLGAVIVTKDRGSYFVKLYGPENTVASGETSFMEMLDSLHAVH
jgi:hypothetical protein